MVSCPFLLVYNPDENDVKALVLCTSDVLETGRYFPPQQNGETFSVKDLGPSSTTKPRTETTPRARKGEVTRTFLYCKSSRSSTSFEHQPPMSLRSTRTQICLVPNRSSRAKNHTYKSPSSLSTCLLGDVEILRVPSVVSSLVQFAPLLSHL